MIDWHLRCCLQRFSQGNLLKKTIFELIAAELLKAAAVPDSLQGLSDTGDPSQSGRPSSAGSGHGMRHFRRVQGFIQCFGWRAHCYNLGFQSFFSLAGFGHGMRHFRRVCSNNAMSMMRNMSLPALSLLVSSAWVHRRPRTVWHLMPEARTCN